MVVMRDQEIVGMANDSSNITEDEAALYDRQIRLWGLDCQRRLREAKVLIIGLNGLGAEVVKNLTLSGVKSITLMDETIVSEKDSSAQFFVMGTEPGQTRAQASKVAIQELNPNVKIEIDSEPITTKPTRFYTEFSAVFATECPVSVLIRVNKICRENNVHFYAGDTWGFHGYGFLDLLKHKFTRVIVKAGEKEPQTVFVDNEFCSLGSALGAKVGFGLNKKVNKVYVLLNIINHFREIHNRFPSPAHREEDLALLKKTRSIVCGSLGCQENKIDDDILSNVFGELSPVCAAVGGVMANEIIKGISRTGEPIYNFFLFDGETCTGTVETIVIRE